jgi:UDP-N-acetylmuramate--alanine ligase
VGVGGAGVSALAHLMIQMGYEVTGSDVSLSGVTEELRAAGATIWQGHDERYVRSADLVVYSTAIPRDNPELAYAEAHDKALLTRIEFLSYLTERHDSVIVSGSHGKSTTSSMIATAFLHAQRDPTVVLGSVVKEANIGSARLGRTKLFVLEGDESNNSILHFKPHVSVVTNIDCDHMDFHGTLSNLKNSFISFLNSPPKNGFSVVCLDDININSIRNRLTGNVVTYGFHRDADYRVEGRRLNRDGGVSFEVHHRAAGPLGVVNLRMPGDHNVQNSLATVAVCHGMGVSFDHVTFALENFPGVQRRYDVLARGPITVIDDYAHHPSEIQALLSAVREVYPRPYRLRVVFQPHRFTRSKNLAQQFPGAFQDADEIVLAKIYDAKEKSIAGIGYDYLNRFFQRRYDERTLKCIGELPAIEEYYSQSMKDGDVILTVGAGDICRVGYGLAAELQERQEHAGAPVDLRRLRTELEAG